MWKLNFFFRFRTHIKLLASFSCNIRKVLVLKERQTYYFSNYFPVFLQFFPVLCNFAWGKWSRMILVQRGSSRFAEDSFARTIASSECISFVRCTQDIKHHQYGAQTSLMLLWETWARVGTGTNFMFMGPRLCSNALPKLIFLKKENSATVTFYSITKL